MTSLPRHSNRLTHNQKTPPRTFLEPVAFRRVASVSGYVHACAEKMNCDMKSMPREIFDFCMGLDVGQDAGICLRRPDRA